MMEIEIEAKAESTKPSLEVLDKAFEVLKKAGFKEETLTKAYDILKGECEEKEAPEMEIKNNTAKNETTAPENKSALVDAMKSFMEKLSK